jgi:hypothetical protein
VIGAANSTLFQQRTNPLPARVEPELEIHEVQHTRFHGHVSHRLRFRGVKSERLVAQDGAPLVNGDLDMLQVHERRRMNRNQISLRTQVPNGAATFPRGNDTDQLTAGRIPEGGSDLLSESAPDHANTHQTSDGHPSSRGGLDAPIITRDIA